MSKHSHNHGNAANAGGAPQEAGQGNTAENLNEAGAGAKNPEPAAAADLNPAPQEQEKPSCEQKIAELEVKLAELNDQYLRKAADFENYRKRMIREKQEITDFANQNLLLDLIPVIDDFERAIKSAETSKDFASFFEGIVMIEKRLSTELENKWGLKHFDSEAQPFDPNRHEAIQMGKAAGITEAVVKEEYLKGYFLKDRVIRYAKVKVLMPEDDGAGTNGEQKTQ